jgi:hypothetical protein
MRKLSFLAIVAVNLAVVGLCIHDHVQLREIRSDFYALTYSLHGPLDESAYFEAPKTVEEVHLYYQRVIGARWDLMKKSMAHYETLLRTAQLHTGIAVLFVASTFCIAYLVGRLRQAKNDAY